MSAAALVVILGWTLALGIDLAYHAGAFYRRVRGRRP